MTTERKIEVLKGAREKIENGNYSMCGAIANALSTDEYNAIGPKSFLSSFGINKPTDARAGYCFWFLFNPHGKARRLELIDEAIEKLKQSAREK